MEKFTRLLRGPSAMFLHYKDGVYAIDADKEFDSANILMNLGKSMEKQLTMPKEQFERYRRSSPKRRRTQFPNHTITRLWVTLLCDHSWMPMIPDFQEAACLISKLVLWFRFA